MIGFDGSESRISGVKEELYVIFFVNWVNNQEFCSPFFFSFKHELRCFQPDILVAKYDQDQRFKNQGHGKQGNSADAFSSSNLYPNNYINNTMN